MILLLGGTAEARALAAELVARGRPLISSLAGRVSSPALPTGAVRIGGFGGVDGLADYLRAEGVDAIVDATHPFAATISAHAAEAASLAGTALLRLQRPGWAGHPLASTWIWVDTTAEALEQPGERPFLTTGRQSLAEFRPWADRHVLARVVDPPEFDLPTRWRLLVSRGPYDYSGERQLLADHACDLLVTKDSGGRQTSAKLDAAADLGIRVIVINRPAGSPGVETVGTVVEVLAWLESAAR